MDIYRHPTFDMACEQFDLVANLLHMPQAERNRVKIQKLDASFTKEFLLSLRSSETK